MSFMIFDITLSHMFEEEEEEKEKEELDDAVLDGLVDDEVADDLLDEHGLPITPPEIDKGIDVFDVEGKEVDDLLEEGEEEVDDYDSFDDHDEL